MRGFLSNFVEGQTGPSNLDYALIAAVVCVVMVVARTFAGV
ncbi:hypothetical protein [Rhodoblastus sp.]